MNAILLSLVIVAIVSNVVAAGKSGNCGNDLFWEYDETTTL